ncbi:hypothetical protein GBZ48_35660 [Azospirillum melinis]|uniref:Uncharacterized protein n=1 Tax=Azospirillum melinis TaxID=328839 RepID=A0ABX2KQ74_9PROT|nr:hypothetical protein [Azospirillum melinis]MBP2310501.1 hypothetical protein [Azospirillum melinis]NUB04531.1 hypothetical protein [Azospirillum melinis]
MDAADHLELVFARLGLDALYVSPSGTETACTVMQAGTPLEFPGFALPVDGVCFDLMRHQVTPAIGGVLRIGERSLAIDTPAVPFPIGADPLGLRWRLMIGWGQPVTLRSVDDAGSPPRGSSWTVAAAAEAGAVTLSIAGTLATGRVCPGDAFRLPGHPEAYVAAGTVAAVAGTFASIPLDRPLAAPVAAGTELVPSWVRDQAVRALSITDAAGFGGSVVKGASRWLVLGGSLPRRPKAGDQLTTEDGPLDLSRVTTHRSGATVVAWDLQAA